MPDSGQRTNHINQGYRQDANQSARRSRHMHHFQTRTGAFSTQQAPAPQPSSGAALPIGLSQAELRDIVIAILG